MEPIVIYPPQKNYRRLILGLFGLVFSLTVLFIFFLPIVKKELDYRIKRSLDSQPVLAEGKDQLAPTESKEESESTPTPTPKEFRLVIPKIGVDTTVFANVDPNDEETYKEALAKGVAHAKGSYLPGQLGSSFIFGHSTDYPWNVGWMNAVFYLLKELEKGDEVYVYYNDKRLDYLVSEKKIVEPEEVAFLKSRLSEERLILQTCWPPGTRLQRLLVISHPKDSALKNL